MIKITLEFWNLYVKIGDSESLKDRKIEREKRD